MGPLMSLGLNSLISREILRRPSDSGLILGSSLVLRFSVGLIVAAIVGAIGYGLRPFSDWDLLTLLVVASSFQAANVFDYWLQAHVANHLAAGVRLAVLLVLSILRILAVGSDASFVVFVYFLSLEFILLAVGYLAVYWHLEHRLGNLKYSHKESHNLLRESRWLLLSGLAAVLYLKIDLVMLGMMLDDTALGVYAAAAKVSEVWYFLPAALVTSYFPALIHKRAEDAIAYDINIQKLNDLLFALAFCVAFSVSLAASWLVPTMFGDAYADAVPVLVVHVWAAILVFMRMLLSKWLIAENLLPLSLLSQLSGAVTNVILNLWWIPHYGALGAAYATLVSYAVSGYAVLFLHQDLRPMAMVVSRSMLLPFRLARLGRNLYQPLRRGVVDD